MSETKPLFTLNQLRLATGSTEENAKKYYQPLLNAMANFQIMDDKEVAAILGTIAIESDHMSQVIEDLYYKDAERLAGLFKRVFDENGDGKISPEEIERAKPYTRNSAALAMKLYGGFQGRGLGQLTWEGNYRRVGNMVGFDYVAKPDLLLEPAHAALSMVAFWVDQKLGAVASDPKKVRRIWNGPKMLKLAEYTAAYESGLKVLAL